MRKICLGPSARTSRDTTRVPRSLYRCNEHREYDDGHRGTHGKLEWDKVTDLHYVYCTAEVVESQDDLLVSSCRIVPSVVYPRLGCYSVRWESPARIGAVEVIVILDYFRRWFTEQLMNHSLSDRM